MLSEGGGGGVESSGGVGPRPALRTEGLSHSHTHTHTHFFITVCPPQMLIAIWLIMALFPLIFLNETAKLIM